MSFTCFVLVDVFELPLTSLICSITLSVLSTTDSGKSYKTLTPMYEYVLGSEKETENTTRGPGKIVKNVVAGLGIYLKNGSQMLHLRAI